MRGAFLVLMICCGTLFSHDNIPDEQRILAIQLCNAIKEKSYETIAELLQKGADPNFVDYDNIEAQTPLAEAVFLADIVSTKLLLDNKADPNIPCNWITEEPVLHMAVYRKNSDLIALLLNYGADPNQAFSNNGSGKYSTEITPLIKAIELEEIAIIQTLLVKGAKVSCGYDYDDYLQQISALDKACCTGNAELVKILLDVLEKEEDRFLLVHALDTVCTIGDSSLRSIASMLYKKIIDKEKDDSLLLRIAVEFQDSDQVRTLLKDGVSPDLIDQYAINNFTVLYYAVLKLNNKIVTCLLEHGADSNKRVKNGLSLLDCLVHDKTDRLNYQTFGSRTQFVHNADDTQRLAMAKLLLAHGANSDTLPDVYTIDDAPPYSYTNNVFQRAVFNKDICLIELFLANGADVDVLNNKGKTALHIAAQSNFGKKHPEILKNLIKESIDINKRDKKGNTALMLATDAATLKILLEYGADTALKNNKDQMV